MKRGRLFIIGLVSAIITIVSLNTAFGSRWNNRYYSHEGYYRCHNKPDDNLKKQNEPKTDSINSNY